MSSAKPSLFHQITGGLLVGGALMGATAMVGIGLKRRGDGWRQIAGVVLRSEASKFTLTTFGLDLWSSLPLADTSRGQATHQLVSRLRNFLKDQPEAHWVIRHRKWSVSPSPRAPDERADLTLVEFGPGGQLLSIHASLDNPVDESGEDDPAIGRAIVDAYNQTRHARELLRPILLQRQLRRMIFAGEIPKPRRKRAWNRARRILGGPVILIEQMTDSCSPQRFVAPDFRTRRHPGWGLLTLIARLDPGAHAVDLWVQAHHNAADGAPIQEMLGRLEKAWGIVDRVKFPTPDSLPAINVPCSTPGAPRDIVMRNVFLDFAPLILAREQVNKRLAAGGHAPIALGALLLWSMDHEREFVGMRFGCTVDVASSAAADRTVNFVAVRPLDFFRDDDVFAGLAEYSAAFRDRVAATRARTGPTYTAISTIALLPSTLQTLAFYLSGHRGNRMFGSLGLSILKDAKVFIAPIADFGFDDGFIAIGSMSLPTAEGRRVASVSIKGDPGKIDAYPAAIARAISACAMRVG